jgi:hypothetical protein
MFPIWLTEDDVVTMSLVGRLHDAVGVVTMSLTGRLQVPWKCETNMYGKLVSDRITVNPTHLWHL